MTQQKKKWIIGGGIVLILSLIIGVSYAFWQITLTQEDENIVQTSCFNISFQDSNPIRLENAYPISDEEGMQLIPYTFTLTNLCQTFVSYQVNLEILNNSTLSSEFIKSSLEEVSPRVLTNITEVEPTLENANESYRLTTGYLTRGKSVTYHLRLWMDEDTPPDPETMNKLFESKVTIVASYVENIENLITSNAISLNDGYDASETFEITVRGEILDLLEISDDKKNWTKLENPGREVTFQKTVTKSGEHAIYVRDDGDNISEVKFIATKVDDKPPIVQLTATSEIREVTVDASKSVDNESGIKTYYYSIDGVSWQASNTNKYTFENLSYIEYTFYVKVEDKIGNISEVVTIKGKPDILGIDYIASLENNGQVLADGTADNNLRYVGTNPNNYVRFNNELWRIVGVMNHMKTNASDEGESRLKIIRVASYGTMAWDSNRSSNWSTASSQNILNTTYLESIEEKSKNMIATTIWTLGGKVDTTAYGLTGMGIYTSNKGGSTWTGSIGLIHLSDAVFGTSGGSLGYNSCLTGLRNWSNSECTNNTWLNTTNYPDCWTMTVYGSMSGAYVVILPKSSPAVNRSHNIYPSLYLKSSVKIISGSGTGSDPYILK